MTASSDREIRLGLWSNTDQFSLLVQVNASLLAFYSPADEETDISPQAS